MFEPIKHNMETIAGVAVYPVLSLLIFFLFFLALGVWVYTYKRETLSAFSHMPLNEDNSNEPLNPAK